MIFKSINVDSKLKPVIYFLVLFSLLTVRIHVGLCAEVTQADKKAYLKALVEAEEVTQEKISTRLLAIVPVYDPISHTTSGKAGGLIKP
jgi:hypothetical protein